MKKTLLVIVAIVMTLPLLFMPKIKHVEAAYNSSYKELTNFNLDPIKTSGRSLLDFIEEKQLEFGIPLDSINGFSLTYFIDGEIVASIIFYGIEFSLLSSSGNDYIFHFPTSSYANTIKSVKYYYNTDDYPTNLNQAETYITGISMLSTTFGGFNPIRFSFKAASYGETLETKQSIFNKVHAKMQESFQLTLGNTDEAPLFIKNGVIFELPTPTREGYIFVDWYQDPALTIPFDITTMPASNLTAYAKWIPKTYHITMHSNGSILLPGIDVKYGADIPSLPDLTWEGYTFAGWYQDAALTELFTASVMPANNLSVYAKWIEDETGEPLPPIIPEDPTDPIEPGESLLDTIRRKVIEPFNDNVIEPINRIIIEPIANLTGISTQLVWILLPLLTLIILIGFINFVKNLKKTNE